MSLVPNIRERLGFSNPSHWTTTDRHRYVSVPTAVPTAWRQQHTDAGLIYSSGVYEIRRALGPNGSRTYTVHRDGVELSLSFTGSLKGAKARAVMNAEGRDVVNVA